MGVMGVPIKITEYFLRAILVFYGLVDLLGVFWFQGSIYTRDLLQGLSFSFAALFVGLAPLPPFVNSSPKLVYLGICLLGISSSVYMGYEYYLEEYRGWDDVVEQLFLAACFIFMAINVVTKQSPINEVG
jgi:hypothetical protein